MRLAAASALLTLGLHLLADQFYLYWVFPWFDILMHFLGGLFLGFFTYGWFGGRFSWFRNLSPAAIFVFVAVFVLILGAVWEGFEFYMDLKLGTSLQPSFRDTMADFCFDAAGALVAAVISYLHVKKNT